MFIEKSSTFHVTCVLILHFDWLQGPHIGQNFEKHSKIFFSETVKRMTPVLCILVLILYFDWLLGPHTGQNLEKHSKFFSSETITGVKPVLCIQVPDSSLYIICVFYSSDKNSGCYGNFKFP